MIKKKINIILILAVLALWGAVGYRFFNNYFHEADAQIILKAKNLNIGMTVERDTFELKPLSRDPFLNKTSFVTDASPNPVIRKPKNYSNEAVKYIPEQLWPTIKYYGYIRSGTKGELALVKIDGVLCRVRKGELLKDVKIKNVYNDSIEIVYNKEVKIFKSS